MELCAQRLQTHPVYPRQNRLQQKCEYPSLLWNVLSRGQATQHAPCAQRKVVLSGLKIQVGWATGTTRVAVPPGSVRLVTRSFLFFFFAIHACETLLSSFTTTVYPTPLCWWEEARTRLCLFHWVNPWHEKLIPTQSHKMTPIQAHWCYEGCQFTPVMAFFGEGRVTMADPAMVGMFMLLPMWCGCFMWWDGSQCATGPRSVRQLLQQLLLILWGQLLVREGHRDASILTAEIH